MVRGEAGHDGEADLGRMRFSLGCVTELTRFILTLWAFQKERDEFSGAQVLAFICFH